MRYLATMVGALALMSASASASAAMAATNAAAAGSEDFHGLGLGVGLSVTLDVGSHDRVNDAEIAAGVVRVKEEENTRPRVMLESHYFFFPDYGFPGVRKDGSFLGVQRGDWGVGPFVAIQPGEDEIIQAAGLGVMMGFRRKEEGNGSWNIGLGFVVDPKTKTLGDGIEEGKALPAGETEIRYKNRSQLGVVILTSFTF